MPAAQVPTEIKAYAPKPGKKIQVIGAGLPRTGTVTFCAAVSYLLDGPSYHIGTHTASDNGKDAPSWLSVLLNRNGPPSGRPKALATIPKVLDGYVCVADPPASQLVPELMEVFPDAIVICTTRDSEKWAESMARITVRIPVKTLQWVYFWVPSLRVLPSVWVQIEPLWLEIYRSKMLTPVEVRQTFERHHEWLREVVPKEKLVMFEVKDGWEPLCKALGVPVPEGVEFPRLNDAATVDAMLKGWAIQGLIRWAVLLGTLVVFIAWYLMR